MLYPSLTDRLRNQHQALSEIIKNVDEQKLMHNPEPGKWSAYDNIVHLTIYQPIFIKRIKRILNEDRPAFNAYRADDDPDFIAGQKLPLVDLLRRLDNDRKEIYTLITGIPYEQLARTGAHPKYGNLSITDWAEFFLLHEAHHLFTIFKLVKG